MRPLLPRRPRHVALCGYPQAGKATLAEFLARRYGAMVVDDGLCLRLAAMKLHGLSWEDVSTQAGKARTRTVCGRPFTVRQLLGDLGNLLEGFYGEQFMPEAAVRAAEEVAATVREPAFFVYPSCRKTQGLTYRALGGVVVEVERPGTSPGENDFDRYDRSLVDLTVVNGAWVDLGAGGPKLFPVDEGEFLQNAAVIFERDLGFEPLGEQAAFRGAA